MRTRCCASLPSLDPEHFHGQQLAGIVMNSEGDVSLEMPDLVIGQDVVSVENRPLVLMTILSVDTESHGCERQAEKALSLLRDWLFEQSRASQCRNWVRSQTPTRPARDSQRDAPLV